jgi:integrase
MTARLHTLKDIHLRNWVKVGQPLARSDGGGLTFTLSGAGCAAWVLRYRHQGKQQELTLGRYPDLSLEAARKRAADLRQQVADGVDVAREKRLRKRPLARISIFGELAEDYMALAAPLLRDSTRAETRRHLDKDILPRLGRVALADLTAADIIGMTEAVASRSQTVARRVYEIASTVCSHGVAKRLLSAHPCTHLKPSSIIGPSARRKRLKLDRAELRAMLRSLPDLGPANELALKIILATCVRKSELILARWEHIDLDGAVWHIPAENAKNGQPFDIPLAPLVAGWFRDLRTRAQRSPWVLPARHRRRGGTDGPISETTLNAALARLGPDVRDFSPHDLRSTARSYLSELGVDLIVAERCLNHSLGGVVATYDQHDYLTERRNALELWAAFIEQAERGEEWNVVPLPRKPATSRRAAL